MLVQMVNETMAGLKGRHTHYHNFSFPAWRNGKRHEEIAQAVGSMSSELRKTFIVVLVDLWEKASSQALNSEDPAWKELQNLFGDELENFSGCIGLRLVFTLTPGTNYSSRDGLELRCWYGYPASYSEDHVDGGDSGMLFSLRGQIAEVRAILDEVQGGRFKGGHDFGSRHFIELENGVRIYGMHLS